MRLGLLQAAYCLLLSHSVAPVAAYLPRASRSLSCVPLPQLRTMVTAFRGGSRQLRAVLYPLAVVVQGAALSMVVGHQANGGGAKFHSESQPKSATSPTGSGATAAGKGRATTLPALYKDGEVPSEHVLPYKQDRYNGVIVDSDYLPDREEDFVRKLESSLEYWRSCSRRGVWLKVSREKARFVHHAVERGFKFHHAEEDYLMLTNWLSDEENRLPPNASHQVGVGCIVVHPKDQKLLLVQEKNGPLRGTGIWKMPTGLVDVGEDLSAAAEREVLEETGVVARFESLLCFRHMHNALFGKSDLFFVCVLVPETTEIVPQAEEIAACEWLTPSAYLEQEFFKVSGVHAQINEVLQHYLQAKSTGDSSKLYNNAMKVAKLPIGWRPGENSLYFIDSANKLKKDETF